MSNQARLVGEGSELGGASNSSDRTNATTARIGINSRDNGVVVMRVACLVFKPRHTDMDWPTFASRRLVC